MKFCKNCGTAVDKNDKICVVCGAKIDEESEKNINESVIADSAEKQNVISSETEEPQMQVNDIEVNKSENKPQAQSEGISKAENKVQPMSKKTQQAEQRSKKNGSEKNKPKKEPINTGAKINNEPKKEVVEKNPNLHSEFEDISSFTAESGKPKKSRKPVIAPKNENNSTTKIVSSVDDVESKTREVNSIAKDETEKNSEKIKKKKPLSKGLKTAIIAGCSILVIAVGIIITCVIIANSGPTAEELFASGQQKYKSEDFYGAITDLSECVKLDTSDVEAYMLLADAYVATGKEDEAVSALEIGYRETGSTKIKTRLDALSEKLRVDKIYNNLVSEGNAAIKNNDYNLAITKFTSAIETKPNISEPYFLVANVYISQENYDKALTVLQSGVDKLEGDELDKLNSKLSEVEATVKKIEEETKKKEEEARKKAEEEQKEKERQRY